MTRLHRLAAHPRRTLGALAVVLAAVGITVGSGANFTASAANPGNAFSTGTLVIANSPSTALLTMSGMKPGDAVELDRRHHEHRLAGRRLRPQDGQPDRVLGPAGPDAADRARLRRLDRQRP